MAANPLDTDFHRRVAKRLKQETDEEMARLASGALEYHDYKTKCGRIKALSDVAEWCEQIESDMNQGR